MMQPNKPQKRFPLLEQHFRALIALLGLFTLVIVFTLSSRTDMEIARNKMQTSVNYIKAQCISYETIGLASETKSLMRVIQSVQQLNREIEADRQLREDAPLDTAALQRYATESYLTGVLLLNPDGTVQAASSFSHEALDETLANEQLLDCAAHPEKTYAVRIPCGEDAYIDLAAFGCTATGGILVGYYHTPAEYARSYNFSFQHLLSGYNVQRDGTLAIAQGDTIIASNDLDLLGHTVDEVASLYHLQQQDQLGQIVHVKTYFIGPHGSYGILDRGRNFYIYVVMPERLIFSTTPKNLLFTIVAYALAAILVLLVRYRMNRQYQEDQLRREQAYQEELKEAARKADAANRAKTQFLQRMSHDIRTPINGIRGMVEIGNYYADDLKKQAECRQKIWDSSGLLLELVNEVLDMGKLESGEVVLEERPFNIIELTREVSTVLEKQAASRGIQITYKEQNVAHPDLVGSPLHLKRLLMNILSNAVKYNKENGTITLTCRELRTEDDRVWIEFICADTGIGMSEEFQKHIFEPFTQENQNARSTYAGTGLGMSITKSLVDKMGGTITFESQQNVGTTYYITLPFRVDSRSADKPHADKPAATNTLDGMHLLLVEDNALNLEIAQFLLEKAGASVATAANGQEAVDAFTHSPAGTYDAILMDVMMPVMDGYEATRTIRALAQTTRPDAGSIPIIAMTANAFVEDRRRAYAAGMNEHLTKPLDSEKLVQVLAQYRRSH